jgi:hypothetical protein
MDYSAILAGREEPLEIYRIIAPALNNVLILPDIVEPVYREASRMDDETLDRLRFALVRIQIHADIHRNEDLERAQQIKYVAQVLEKIIYGSLMIAHEAESD